MADALPTVRLKQVLGEVMPEALRLLGSPMERKLNVAGGEDEHGTDHEFINVDMIYAEGRNLDNGRVKIKGDVTKLLDLFEPESFDILFAHHILEHVDYREAWGVVKEWVSLLAPGGLLYICIPDSRWAMFAADHGAAWDSLAGVRRGKLEREDFGWDLAQFVLYAGGDHKSAWWDEPLVKVVQDAGLENVKTWNPGKLSTKEWLPLCEQVVVGTKGAR